MGAVEAVLPHNMADVLMEGVRKMGQSAQIFLTLGNPNDIVTLAEKIALVSCAGVMHQNFRPVTLVGMEQLVELTFNLIRSKTPDIRFAVEKVRANVALIVRMNWLRVLGTAEFSQVDQRIRQQLHPKVSLLNTLKPQKQPFERIFPGKGPVNSCPQGMNYCIE